MYTSYENRGTKCISRKKMLTCETPEHFAPCLKKCSLSLKQAQKRKKYIYPLSKDNYNGRRVNVKQEAETITEILMMAQDPYEVTEFRATQNKWVKGTKLLMENVEMWPRKTLLFVVFQCVNGVHITGKIQ